MKIVISSEFFNFFPNSVIGMTSIIIKYLCFSQNHILAYLTFILQDMISHGKGVMIMFRTLITFSFRIFAPNWAKFMLWTFNSVTKTLTRAWKSKNNNFEEQNRENVEICLYLLVFSQKKIQYMISMPLWLRLI